MWGLEGHIGLPAPQPLPCLSGSCAAREGHERLVCKYTWFIGNCATWRSILAPLSCCSLVAFKPLNSCLPLYKSFHEESDYFEIWLVGWLFLARLKDNYATRHWHSGQ